MRTILMLRGAATAVVAFPAAPLAGQNTACAAIAASDIASVVGSAPVKAVANGCSWTKDKEHWVMILDNTPKSTPMPVDVMFNAARNAAARSGTVTDESGLGDKAFLAISSSGVAALQMVKKGRLLQVQVSAGSAPSAATLTLVRSVAKKAIAAF